MSSKAQKDSRARTRAEWIIKVLNKEVRASEAAKVLGISRKTYYKWEKRFVEAAVEAVGEREAGRPSKPPIDPQTGATTNIGTTGDRFAPPSRSDQKLMTPFRTCTARPPTLVAVGSPSS